MTAIQHCCNPLLPSIACKSIGGTRNARSALWRCFTSGSLQAKCLGISVLFCFFFGQAKKIKTESNE